MSVPVLIVRFPVGPCVRYAATRISPDRHGGVSIIRKAEMIAYLAPHTPALLEWEQHRPAGRAVTSTPAQAGSLAEVLTLFLANRQKLNLREATLDGYRVFARWLRRHYGARPASSITDEDCRRIYAKKGRGFCIMLMAFFRWALSEKQLAHDPTVGLLPRAPRRDEAPIAYLSARDAHRFLAAVDRDHRAAFALALYAGLRPHEICRLDWRAIKVGERRIKIAAWVSKTRRARMIEQVPIVLWRLLRPLARPSGPLIPGHRVFGWMWQRRKAARRAGVELSHDVLRHTFATYFVALTGDPSRCAKILGHQDLEMLGAHYDGVATSAEARRFFHL